MLQNRITMQHMTLLCIWVFAGRPSGWQAKAKSLFKLAFCELDNRRAGHHASSISYLCAVTPLYHAKIAKSNSMVLEYSVHANHGRPIRKETCCSIWPLEDLTSQDRPNSRQKQCLEKAYCCCCWEGKSSSRAERRQSQSDCKRCVHYSALYDWRTANIRWATEQHWRQVVQWHTEDTAVEVLDGFLSYCLAEWHQTPCEGCSWCQIPLW